MNMFVKLFLLSVLVQIVLCQAPAGQPRTAGQPRRIKVGSGNNKMIVVVKKLGGGRRAAGARPGAARPAAVSPAAARPAAASPAAARPVAVAAPVAPATRPAAVATPVARPAAVATPAARPAAAAAAARPAPASPGLRRTCPADMSPCACKTVPNGLPILDCSMVLKPTDLRTTTSPLRKVPTMKFSKIVIDHAVLELLPARAFGTHHADEYIFTDTNELENILRGAFGPLANPRRIIIERCGIETFPFPDLVSMTNLQEFTISGTSITLIPPGAFAIPNGALTTIRLDQNEIMEIGELAFDKLLKLQSINLAQNVLTALPLRTLHLANNIQLLNISHNGIVKVNRHAFGPGFPKTMDLSFNMIPSFQSQPWSAFVSAMNKHPDKQQTSNLNMADNPIPCECPIRWLYNAQPAVKNVVTGITCLGVQQPANLFTLPASHFSGCPKPAAARPAPPAANAV